MNRDWYIIKEQSSQLAIGFGDEETIELHRMGKIADAVFCLTAAEVYALHALVEAEVTRRAALTEQERIKAEAQQAATQEAIDRMDDDSLTARCALEAARRGWTE